MIGQVVKSHSSNFIVNKDGKLYDCSARGLLKRNKSSILCGDFVEFDNGVINKILDRKNSFIRPSVANIDTVVIVIASEPKPDFYLIDKLTINAIKEDCEIIFVINKTDITDELYNKICDEYKHCSNKFIKVSAKDNIGIDELRKELNGKLCVLAGQSAVGKTSLINSLFFLNLKTGELSEKIQRGKHTTTSSEMHVFGDIKIIDSPGFAVIDADVDLTVLPECYPEYFDLQSGCKFRGCAHISEPDCKVKQAVKEGKLSIDRYNRYVEIYKEVLERREIYD